MLRLPLVAPLGVIKTLEVREWGVNSEKCE